MNEDSIKEEMTITDLKKVHFEQKDWPLTTIKEMFEDHDIISQPDFQREFKDDTKIGSKLVESMIIGIPIPPVYLCSESDGTFSVIDGQQRMTLFVNFMQNKYALKGLEELTELNGKKYGDLDKLYQKVLKQGTLNCIILDNEDSDLKYEIFARLNQGATKLTPQELRNCLYRGSFNDMIEDIADNNKNLEKLFVTANKGKKYQEYILRFFALRNYVEYKSAMKTEMNRYMEKHQNDDEKSIAEAKKLFNSKIDIVKQVFGEDIFCAYDRTKGEFMKKFSGPVYDSIMVACSLFDNHTLMQNADAIRKTILEIKKNNLDYYDCTYGGTGSKDKVVGRINIIYNAIRDITGKNSDQEPRRLFTKTEKEELWHDGMKCAYCGQEILSIDDAEVDHIVVYSKGGDTTLDNAQLLHKHCNREKYNNQDDDITNEYDDIDQTIEDEEE